KLQQEMRAVAIGRVASVLAAAKQRGFGPLGCEHEGFKACAGMGAVAEGLLGAPAAAAPGVSFVRLELDLVGAQLWPFRLGHNFAPGLCEAPTASLPNSPVPHKKAASPGAQQACRMGEASAIVAPFWQLVLLGALDCDAERRKRSPVPSAPRSFPMKIPRISIETQRGRGNLSPTGARATAAGLALIALACGAAPEPAS